MTFLNRQPWREEAFSTEGIETDDEFPSGIGTKCISFRAAREYNRGEILGTPPVGFGGAPSERNSYTLAKLYYRYGTMNSGKSMDILKIANNYEEQGKSVLIFTSVVDTRHGIGKVTSRVGFQREALLLNGRMREIVEEAKPDCVVVDEAQFATPEQIDMMADIVDQLNIPVIAYGLMTDFQGKLFEGSKRLLETADRIEEVKTVCWYCNSKARFNTRFQGERAVFTGEQVDIGGNDKYRPLCRKCYRKEKEKSERLAEAGGREE